MLVRVGRLKEGEETIGTCCRLSHGLVVTARHYISSPDVDSSSLHAFGDPLAFLASNPHHDIASRLQGEGRTSLHPLHTASARWHKSRGPVLPEGTGCGYPRLFHQPSAHRFVRSSVLLQCIAHDGVC